MIVLQRTDVECLITQGADGTDRGGGARQRRDARNSQNRSNAPQRAVVQVLPFDSYRLGRFILGLRFSFFFPSSYSFPINIFL